MNKYKISLFIIIPIILGGGYFYSEHLKEKKDAELYTATINDIDSLVDKYISIGDKKKVWNSAYSGVMDSCREKLKYKYKFEKRTDICSSQAISSADTSVGMTINTMMKKQVNLIHRIAGLPGSDIRFKRHVSYKFNKLIGTAMIGENGPYEVLAEYIEEFNKTI